jgi:hypothetical protein
MNYFQLAEPMSRILIGLETGHYSETDQVPVLYSPGAIRNDMMTIITHWSIATGRDIKAGKVTASPRAAVPVQPVAGAPALPAAAAGNGQSPRVGLSSGAG